MMMRGDHRREGSTTVDPYGCGGLTTVVRDRPPSTPTDNIVMQAYCLIF